MYDAHFGLSGRPFQLTPDARFWYETATHRKAMAYLGYGLAQGEGFVVVTGDIGAGKTTLVGHLTAQVDPAALNVITIVSTAIPADDLLRIVATGLGVDPQGLAKAQLLTAIERGLHAVARSGRRTLLIVDEAQALPIDSLEELRMLSNFQAGGHALLQILLLGQPEFRERLHGSDRLEQLRQRVIAIHHLDPMEAHEVADYIAHRLSVVGWQGRPDFAADAFAALYEGSGGVPRRLNQLAGRVMLHAAVEGLGIIDGPVVRQVLGDLNGDLPMQANEPAAIAPEPVAVEADSSVRRFVPRAAPTAPAAPEPDAEHRAQPLPAAVEARIAALEARVNQQEGALRRVLTLLVDWVEADRQEAAVASAAMAAGAAEIREDHVPIRPPAAWDHAA
ncbi:ExeA family protein [Sphingomonas melonis]|uniref:Putative secretion ATPase (PEP-CTERM system associated) n=1 Tax=Sphingomonas melonis TaxID=152682 RepID=A0A7Y9FMS3_9SPHN|nr:AAA family ATPase [Sphingomonas melonis]NYD90176.1 putative secretion ATPase (PEP-CTERM system associated) [Sphingomonas melonis]